MKVLITGGKGMLGRTLQKCWQDWDLVIADLPEADICDPAGFDRLIKDAKPDAVVHCAAMTQVDYEIGRLRDALFAQGLDRSNTIIAFVSDHGELLGDHCLFRKSLPYEGSAHVPLIISASREALERAGYTGDTATADKLAELRDVMPTLLSLCGIPVPDTVDGINLFGDEDRTCLHGEHLYDGESCQWILSRENGRMEKFIWFSGSGRRQYFDLTTDPDETHDGIGDACYAGRITVLERTLTDALAWREEGFVKDGKLTPGAVCRPVLEHGQRETE